MVLSDSTCPNSEWSEYWNREVAGIKFRGDDTATELFFSYPGSEPDSVKVYRVKHIHSIM